MTFAQDIESRAAGEPILGAVIGGYGWGSISDEPGEAYGASENDAIPFGMRGCVLSWEQARPLLDYEYDDGYGSPKCHAITAWTERQVLFVVQYDGATWVASVTRNPEAHEPHMFGGG